MTMGDFISLRDAAIRCRELWHLQVYYSAMRSPHKTDQACMPRVLGNSAALLLLG